MGNQTKKITKNCNIPQKNHKTEKKSKTSIIRMSFTSLHFAKIGTPTLTTISHYYLFISMYINLEEDGLEKKYGESLMGPRKKTELFLSLSEKCERLYRKCVL